MNIDPNKDGIDHINVYSKAKTELGRKLTNFSNVPFVHPSHGEFQSIEGYWYWLGCTDDKLRKLYGFRAKQYGREVGAPDWQDSEEFKENIKVALVYRFKQNPSLLKLFRDSDLPLRHYYVFGGKVVEPKEGKWIIDFLSDLRLMLKIMEYYK